MNYILNISYADFIFAFAKELNLKLQNAEQVWTSYSKQLSDSARELVEGGGATSGQAQAKEYRVWVEQNKEKK